MKTLREKLLERENRVLTDEINEVRSNLRSEIITREELQEDLDDFQSDYFRMQANRVETEHRHDGILMQETALLTREKEWTTELQEARKALSNALQESLDREAVQRKEIRKLKRDLLNI